MYIPFSELPESSRIWIYQANRSFSEDELKEIGARTEAFLKEWTVHGETLQAGYEIRYKRFIVIGLNQGVNAASGCSIDASVHFIQQLEKDFEVDLLDKMNVSYKQGEYIAYKPLLEFKKMAKDRAVSGKTIVFNNLVATKQDYEEHWEVPAEESWHARFVK
ncbi:ABC transporter ATPase [Sinomicrobium soli]|uniref:ABC transporter ATPase n=1 Tax=Sinomicrobium sp. N-1-3-6 TaxID=2219864 RepID=UPI000DCBEC16|nr:ABC transporter ATPase [Sinomicrobium sp. N-1-3-6]RAV28397.1 ABC transporter ATPase [Sinomicrobium sp. N-1-3-6]